MFATAFQPNAFQPNAFQAGGPWVVVVETPAEVPRALPVASGGAVALYDDDWSSFRRPKRKKKTDRDGPPVVTPATPLAQGPPRSTADVARALLRAPSPIESPVDDEDDDEEVLQLLLLAS